MLALVCRDFRGSSQCVASAWSSPLTAGSSLHRSLSLHVTLPPGSTHSKLERIEPFCRIGLTSALDGVPGPVCPLTLHVGTLPGSTRSIGGRIKPVCDIGLVLALESGLGAACPPAISSHSIWRFRGRDWRCEEIKPIGYVRLILALRSVLGATC